MSRTRAVTITRESGHWWIHSKYSNGCEENGGGETLFMALFFNVFSTPAIATPISSLAVNGVQWSKEKTIEFLSAELVKRNKKQPKVWRSASVSPSIINLIQY